MQGAVNMENEQVQALVQKHLEENESLESEFMKNQDRISQDYWDFVMRQDSETMSVSDIST
jgi:hypothetical protein